MNNIWIDIFVIFIYLRYAFVCCDGVFLSIRMIKGVYTYLNANMTYVAVKANPRTKTHESYL